MNRVEFIQKVDYLKSKIVPCGICIDKESFADYYIGAYWDTKEEKWKVYQNYERGLHSIWLETKDEDEAFNKLYSLVNSEIKM